jgi:hypothetical protein
MSPGISSPVDPFPHSSFLRMNVFIPFPEFWVNAFYDPPVFSVKHKFVLAQKKPQSFFRMDRTAWATPSPPCLLDSQLCRIVGRISQKHEKRLQLGLKIVFKHLHLSANLLSSFFLSISMMRFRPRFSLTGVATHGTFLTKFMT